MNASIPQILMRCEPETRAKIVASLPPASARLLNRHFPEWTHAGQRVPDGDWRTWVLMAGRGFGKTRTGAEWVMSLARPSAAVRAGDGLRGRGAARIALVAASLDEARRVMVEGPSGILAVARPGEVREWSFQRRRILFASGAEATLFSGAHPDGLRGPEHDFAWCDELAKWRYPKEAWDNLQLGLRRGERPRALVTTTPRRGQALKALLGEAGVITTRGVSAANPHLPEGWVGRQAARLSGMMRRQELEGELIDEVEGALWPRALIEACRSLDVASRLRSTLARDERFTFTRIVVGVDPPASRGGNACGIVACGLGVDGIGYVLGDHSAGGLSPEGWARKVAAAEIWGAQRVVAEANNGGDMVEAVLKGAGVALPVKLVRASQAKAARAGPVAALFESGRARFAGHFPALEDELAGLSYFQDERGGGSGSPDRADAMVWALTELMLGAGGKPSVRGL